MYVEHSQKPEVKTNAHMKLTYTSMYIYHKCTIKSFTCILISCLDEVLQNLLDIYRQVIHTD